MHDRIKHLTLWHQKDQIICQIEEIAESTDWYRGGRKIGNLKRAYKQGEKTTPEVERLFDARIMAAHQTYMDRLAVHKLKGPADQASLKSAEIRRIAQQSELFRSTIRHAEALLATFQDPVRGTEGEGRDGTETEEGDPAAQPVIEQIERAIKIKKNRIVVNDAFVEVLQSDGGYVGCSGTVRTVEV